MVRSAGQAADRDRALAAIVVGLAAVPLAVRLVFGSAAYVVALLLLRTFDAHDSDSYAASRAVPRPGRAGVEP